ncbi:MAG: hypothetical protein ACI4TB_09185 [Lachnospiraceae bacterium]
MNPKQADAALQNIFAACEKSPNTVSLNKLALRQKANTRIYDRLLLLTAILLLLTFLSPLALSPAASLFGNDNSPSKATLVADSLTDGVLCLTLSGEGILYEEAYQETADGIVEGPVSYDESTGTIYFTYHATDTNIYIPLENAPVFHLLLSPR